MRDVTNCWKPPGLCTCVTSTTNNHSRYFPSVCSITCFDMNNQLPAKSFFMTYYIRIYIMDIPGGFITDSDVKTIEYSWLSGCLKIHSVIKTWNFGWIITVSDVKTLEHSWLSQCLEIYLSHEILGLFSQFIPYIHSTQRFWKVILRSFIESFSHILPNWTVCRYLWPFLLFWFCSKLKQVKPILSDTNYLVSETNTITNT